MYEVPIHREQPYFPWDLTLHLCNNDSSTVREAFNKYNEEKGCIPWFMLMV